MAMDKNRDLAVTSSVLLLVLLWHTEAVPSEMNADSSKSNQLETTTPSSRSSNCSLLSVDLDSIELNNKIHSGYPLVEIELRILNYSADFLNRRLTGFFQPNYWVRSQGQTGISLLVWETKNWNLFKPYYKIGVDYFTVKLADFPPGCLKSLNAENTAFIIRELLLNDFKIKKQKNSEGVQNTDVQLCNQIIKETKQSAMFVYHCCEVNINGDVICEEAKANIWLDRLTRLRIPILVALYFYGLALMTYFLQFAIPTAYLCEISAPILRPIRFLYKNDPRNVCCNYQTTTMEKVCNTKVKGEERFKKMSAQICDGADYPGTSNRLQLIMMSRRLLTQNEVPVGMYSLLYNLFTCRFHHIEVFEGDEEGHYCDHPFMGKCNIKLYRFLQQISKAFMLLILSTPLIIMIVNFYRDKPHFEEKERIVKEINLTASAQTESCFLIVNVILLGPFYLFYLADMLLCGFVWKCIRPAFKKTFQRHTDKNSKYPMLCIKKLLRFPFKIPCWRLCYVPFFCVTTIVCIVISGIKLIPCLHLMHQLFYILPSSLWKCFVFFLILISVYTGFVIWSLFIVNVFFHTIIGIIIYAEPTMKILTGIILVLIYGRTTFNKVWQDYMDYHSNVFEILSKTAKKKSDEFSLNRQKSRGTRLRSGQENSQEVMKAFPEAEETTCYILPLTTLSRSTPISKMKQAMLRIRGMFLVVDEPGQYFMPVEFFYQAIKIDSCLSPGPICRRYIDAFISYIKIIIFLIFIYIVVMAFGETYKTSLTYELLATVITSLVPLILNVIKSGDTTVKQNDEDFEEKLRAQFDEYEEDFPISDFVSSSLEEVPEQSQDVDTDAKVDLIIINTTQPQQNTIRLTRNIERQHLV